MTTSEKSIIIIGSGVAGLSSARYLADHTDYNITVLEANPNRFGGRIWSFVPPGYPDKRVEFGAMWLHQGNDHNHPIRRLMEKANVELIFHDVFQSRFVDIYDRQGKLYGNNECLKLPNFSDRINDIRNKLIRENLNDSPIKNAVENLGPEFTESDIIRHFMIPMMESYHGAMIDKVSLIYSDGVPNARERLKFRGIDAVASAGYDRLLHYLLACDRKFSLIMGCQVTSVRFNSEINQRKVRVTCESSNTNNLSHYLADHVIIAVPISVLKQNLIKFEPPLPDSHTDALKNFGFESKLKVLIMFDSAFWLPSKECICITANDPTGFPAYILNLHKINGVNGLLAMIAGKGVALAEKMTEAEVIEKILDRLRCIFGGKIVDSARIIYTKIVNWGSEPFINGAYSFAKPGMSHKDAYAVREPVKPYLFFAGEHTAMPENAQGTVLGAFISGVRAAREILSSNGSPENDVEEEPSINFWGKNGHS